MKLVSLNSDKTKISQRRKRDFAKSQSRTKLLNHTLSPAIVIPPVLCLNSLREVGWNSRETPTASSSSMNPPDYVLKPFCILLCKIIPSHTESLVGWSYRPTLFTAPLVASHAVPILSPETTTTESLSQTTLAARFGAKRKQLAET